MKKLIYLVSALVLVACGSNKSQPAAETFDPAQNEELPTILREHPNLSEFTLLQQEHPEQITLFTDGDTTKYHFFDEKNGRNVDPTLFRIEDGTIHMDGENGGYIMTNQGYKNYYVRCQVKWGSQQYGRMAGKPKNGGLQFGIPENSEDKLWPDNYEYEIMVGALGELWTSRPFETKNDTIHPFGGPNFCETYVSDKTLEKPDSVWNTCELICYDNHVEHYLNGKKVLEATVPEGNNQGLMLLQYEYTDIYYKDIVLIPLK